mgnify:CR=1 FL=1
MSYAVSLRQRGLSLLELLVAFAIMAIALGMLYKASGSSARSVGEIQSYQRAVSLAGMSQVNRQVFHGKCAVVRMPRRLPKATWGCHCCMRLI